MQYAYRRHGPIKKSALQTFNLNLLNYKMNEIEQRTHEQTTSGHSKRHERTPEPPSESPRQNWISDYYLAEDNNRNKQEHFEGNLDVKYPR